MKVLVLGGTRFIGRHIVDALTNGGHEVTVFTRGTSPDDLPASVRRLHGDRKDGPAALEALRGGRWEACVDVSGYTPLQVRSSAEQLRDAVNRYVFVSTVSVYSDVPGQTIVETDPLLDEAAEAVTEVTGETYGPLKVTCERIVRSTYPDRFTILRPQIVAGPRDPTGRHTYWVQRASRDGEVLMPGDGSDHVQVVDARDIARFTVNSVERSIGGIFNMAGPRLTWKEFAEMLGVRHPTWLDAGILEEEQLTFAELPLYIRDGGPHSGYMHVRSERAQAAGFTTTDPRTTIRDTAEWLRAHPMSPVLSPERERQAIAAASQKPRD
jgi:2'-hydroxyisoflavone reductase